MNKILFEANPDTNYVFHMLSVARCGYDNAYGATHRHRYPAEDLRVIKEQEIMLTVCGGQHCGELHHLMVCLPARGEVSAKEYYKQLIQAVEANTLAWEYTPHAGVIRSVAQVMVKYYDAYIQNIWPGDKLRIEAYISELEEQFRSMDFARRAEAAVGNSLPRDHFIAVLTASMENGAEAIDISPEQDVFGIERSVMDAVYFIGHEFIIYLLFDALWEENAFRSMNTWPLTEGLAEFYLKKIMGDTRFFNRQRHLVEFYESCPPLSTVELYRKASQHFLSDC